MTNKKYILFVLKSIMSGFLVMARASLAQENGFGTSYLQELNLGDVSLMELIINMINVILGFLAIITIIIILWGGFRWLTAGGSEDKVAEAKKTIVNGVIGLVIIIASYAITTFLIENLTISTGTETAEFF
ncbi:hypothetical protein C4569_00565 [Candidatus Parcubacteria bacterium]|nr:MAG: hypothetical protein C4569_00565 [Candidatus Parcubacteria bacterium]